MGHREWRVLIADVKGSRSIPARERPGVDAALKKGIARTLRTYRAHFRLPPQVLKGDELQAVLKPGAPALQILTYLRAQLALGAQHASELRAGIGHGRVSRLSPKGPFSSEGEAFHRARQALDHTRAAGGARMTAWISGVSQFDTMADAILALTDAIGSRWTRPQWEAVAGRLEGKALQDIGRETGVKFQNVSKRLRAASWNEVQHALGHLERSSTEAVTGPREP